ncbi:MAG TPA: hypothetical protein VFT59_00380 [Candidatus Saccharimonadales bacterium]|nr:hypothetical protein [Candidatus Saccharimonadales bacterium]
MERDQEYARQAMKVVYKITSMGNPHFSVINDFVPRLYAEHGASMPLAITTAHLGADSQTFVTIMERIANVVTTPELRSLARLHLRQPIEGFGRALDMYYNEGQLPNWAAQLYREFRNDMENLGKLRVYFAALEAEEHAS